MVNVSRPFRCSGCGNDIRIMYTGTSRKAVDDGILKVVKDKNPYASEFLNQSGNIIRGYIMNPGDSYYDEAVYAYRPHRCSRCLRKGKIRIPGRKTA